MVRHITDDLESSIDDSDKEQIKDMRMMVVWKSKFENVIFKEIILKSYFLGSNFENIPSEVAILKMYFWREHFSKYISWGSNFE